MISKDIENLTAEIQRSSERETDILKLVEITVHRLETLKAIHDDPSRDLCSDEPWQVVLLALEKFIEAKDPLPDKMMTEWHQLMANIKVKQKKIEAMEKNLAEITKANDNHIQEIRSRLDLHYRYIRGMDLNTET